VFLLLTIRPFLPPCMLSTAFSSGTSGKKAKVLLMPPLTESMRAADSKWTGSEGGPETAATRSGKVVGGGAQEDRAAQRA